MEQLGYKQSQATCIFEDNMACIHFVYGRKFSNSVKHIGVRQAFVRDSIDIGELEVKFVASQDQPADIMTKPLPESSFTRLRDKYMTLGDSAIGEC